MITKFRQVFKAPTKFAYGLWQLTYKNDDCSAIYKGKGVTSMQNFKFKISSLLGNKLISLVSAYFLDFSGRRPALVSERCVVQQES